MSILRSTVIAVLTMCSVAGCSNLTTLNTKINSTVSDTVTLTDADLKIAINIANAASPPDTEALSCFTWLDNNLAAVQAAISATTSNTPNGIFSAFEVAHLATNNVQNGISPVMKTGFEGNCGAFTANIIGGVQGLINAVANGAATIALPPTGIKL